MTFLMKASDLVSPALDWAVAVALGLKTVKDPFGPNMNQGWWIKRGVGYQRISGGYSPSTIWDQGGPIIDRNNIGFLPSEGHRGDQARAFIYAPSQHDLTFGDSCQSLCHGPTPLIAAMRCFVVSKLGDDIEIPEELK